MCARSQLCVSMNLCDTEQHKRGPHLIALDRSTALAATSARVHRSQLEVPKRERVSQVGRGVESSGDKELPAKLCVCVYKCAHTSVRSDWSERVVSAKATAEGSAVAHNLRSLLLFIWGFTSPPTAL